MSNKVEDTIISIKEKLPNVTPTPSDFHTHANAHELKSRLNFGEPGLTILDVRERTAFDESRILGATYLSVESLGKGEQPKVELNRDIYVYAATDEETSAAANLLRGLGFSRVAELKGGLKAWQSIGGAVEGRATVNNKPGVDAFNVLARLKKFSEEQSREKSLK